MCPKMANLSASAAFAAEQPVYTFWPRVPPLGAEIQPQPGHEVRVRAGEVRELHGHLLGERGVEAHRKVPLCGQRREPCSCFLAAQGMGQHTRGPQNTFGGLTEALRSLNSALVS